ncbi:MAG: RidA family protein [Gammaproteobacteria bacterium]|nr:RidA family protein [Gammaproteobacteria bacterium]
MDKLLQVTTDDVPEPEAGNFCNALKVGKQVFMSGMTASDPTGDAYAQSLSCLQKIRALVEAAGGTMADIVKITVFLTDIAHRTEFSRARAEFFPGRKPCSTLIAISALAHPGLVVEVEAVAFIGAGA